MGELTISPRGVESLSGSVHNQVGGPSEELETKQISDQVKDDCDRDSDRENGLTCCTRR